MAAGLEACCCWSIIIFYMAQLSIIQWIETFRRRQIVLCKWSRLFLSFYAHVCTSRAPIASVPITSQERLIRSSWNWYWGFLPAVVRLFEFRSESVKYNGHQKRKKILITLTLTPLKWRIWCAPTSASKWRMGFNSAFKGLINTNRGFVSLSVLLLEDMIGQLQTSLLLRANIKFLLLSSINTTLRRHKLLLRRNKYVECIVCYM